MDSNIFGLQCLFVEDWDNKYKEYSNKNKEERLEFFKKFNEEISNFFHRYIDQNIWQIQRAYFFAFWIGLLYLKNIDCIIELEKILNFSPIYTPFKNIVKMLNNKVRRTILSSDNNESRIIGIKMGEFREEYGKIEEKINRIIKFYRVCKRKEMLTKYCTSITVLRKKLPDDIVLNIMYYLSFDNDIVMSYLQNKWEVDMIIEECGLRVNRLGYVLEVFFRNDRDIVNTILEIISCS